MSSGHIRIALNSDIALELVRIEGGEFSMGSNRFNDEEPVHRVCLSDYYMGIYPVTQAQWAAVMGPGVATPGFPGAQRPMETVDWHESRRFTEKLSDLSGYAVSLPTEAQWEYAARGGPQSQGFEYAGSDYLDEVGWFNENSYRETKPVGQKLPNELGLYDMSGNVWEWCADWYGNYPSSAEGEVLENPEGPEEGAGRVLRGGSYFYNAIDCRCAPRYRVLPDFRNGALGFRVVVSAQSVEKKSGLP